MTSLQLSSTYERETIREAAESRLAPLRFYAELFVEYSPEVVWSQFSDLTKWTEWSPICRGCRINDEQTNLECGSILEVSFAIMGVTLTVPARVIRFDPPTSITWRGEKLGIKASHTYSFIPRKGGTLLCNEETFTGAGFPLNGLITAWYRMSKLSGRSLAGLRRELEKTTSPCAPYETSASD
jgi:ligand-binding SRPBCC domain-containing protein